MLITTKVDADLTQIGADAQGFAGNGGWRVGLTADGGFAGAIHPCLLHRHRLPGIPQPVAVIERNGGDQGHIGFHHIGGIEPPPSPTSSSSTSGAARRNSQSPARVANSKKVRAVSPRAASTSANAAQWSLSASSSPLIRTRSVKRNRWGEE